MTLARLNLYDKKGHKAKSAPLPKKPVADGVNMARTGIKKLVWS